MILAGFSLAICLGLLGSWVGDHSGAIIGMIFGLGFSFVATAFAVGH